jgi:hypothetical protein
MNWLRLQIRLPQELFNVCAKAREWPQINAGGASAQQLDKLLLACYIESAFIK